MDIARLQSIISTRFAIPAQYNIHQLTPYLMQNLGAIGWEQRDYSYMILSAWIWGWYDRPYYSPQERLELAERAKENIKTGLGDPESDGVFLRSYSIFASQ
jgi:hypothetical protein